MANPKIRVQLAPSFRATVTLSRCKPKKAPGSGGGGVIVTPSNPGGAGDTSYALTDENGNVLVDESGNVLTYGP